MSHLSAHTPFSIEFRSRREKAMKKAGLPSRRPTRPSTIWPSRPPASARWRDNSSS